MHSTETLHSVVLPPEEAVIQIPLTGLHPFPNHPFKVRDDEAMRGMLESVREYGVLTPAIVRSRESGGYEIIAGHRRKHASEIAELEVEAESVSFAVCQYYGIDTSANSLGYIHSPP